MHGVIFDHQMNIEVRRNIVFDMLEKIEVLLMSMAAFTFEKNLARGNVKSVP
jgi:hypothetical protein